MSAQLQLDLQMCKNEKIQLMFELKANLATIAETFRSHGLTKLQYAPMDEGVHEVVEEIPSDPSRADVIAFSLYIKENKNKGAVYNG